MRKKDFLLLAAGMLSGMLFMYAAFLLRKDGNVSLQHGTGSRIEQKAGSIMEYIDKYYTGKTNNKTMEDEICKGLVKGLGDIYSSYYTKEEYEDIMEKQNGAYCGIGVYLSEDKNGNVLITNTVKESPAQKSGLKAGDIIYSVDGKESCGFMETASMIKGENGTKTELKIYRKGEEDYLNFSVVREEIKEETVTYQMTGNAGYIKVTSFEAVTGRQFENAVDALEKDKMEKLVIDLRDNGGGLFMSAVNMLNRILPESLLVYTKDKDGKEEKFYADNKERLDIPIAVLINENSASAAEIFAGALQDNGAAKLVGMPSFGKGIVQTMFNLGDGSALKITTSEYYTPCGKNINHKGLVPDIEIELDNTGIKEEEGLMMDNQVKAALGCLE